MRGARAIAAVALSPLFVAVAFGAGVARASADVFVANYSADDVAVYSRNASGDVPPTRTIRDGLTHPHTIAIDPLHGEMFVSNNLYASQGPSIVVYGLGGETPKRRIAGPLTGLTKPAGLTVDPVNGELYVANDLDSGSSITVYPLTADGNVPPVRTLKGPATGIEGPIGMAVDFVHGELIVVSYKVANGGSIASFPRTASGNVPPLRTIQGPQTGFDEPQGLALDPVQDELIVANSAFQSDAPGNILVFPRMAFGDVAPRRVLGGPATGLCNPVGLTLDLAHDEIAVANSHFSSYACDVSVTVYARDARGDAAPLRKLGPGPLSALSHPTSAAFTPSASCPPPSVLQGRACVVVGRTGGSPVLR